MIDNINFEKLLKEKYFINKKNKNYTTLFKKFSRRFPKEFIDELLDGVNNKHVYLFVDYMKLKGKDRYLENFYSNLSNSILIKNKLIQKLLLTNEVFGGSFFTKRNNYIILGDTDILDKGNASLTPYHELFHLLTTRIDDKDTVRIGFQVNEFATGINEGYTELLTKRYFGNLSDKDFNAYSHFTWFMEMLEDIIGKDKIEDLYFNSNIEGLILELGKYIPKEQVLDFIEDTDLLFESEHDLFDYQKNFIYGNKELDSNQINEYYNLNKELRDRIYNNLLEINDNKQKKIGKENNFKEKNDKIKEQIDREEELYQDYFKYECKYYLKK